MQKVQVIGPRDELPKALDFLQRRGVLQLRAFPQAVGAEADAVELVRPIEPTPEVNALASALIGAAERSATLRGRLPPVRAFGPAEPLPEPGGREFEARIAALEAEVGDLGRRRAALVDEQEATSRFERLVVALSPIGHRVDTSLEPEIHGLFLDEGSEALALLANEVERITQGHYDLDARALGDGQVGALLTIPRAASREISALLFAHGVEEVRLPLGFAGKRLIDVLLLLASRRQAIPGEIAEIDRSLSRIASSYRPSLDEAERLARAAHDRLRAADSCGETRFAFVVSGWTPADQVAALRTAAEEELGGRVALLAHAPERTEWGAVPVVLRNPTWLRPFQLLLALVPLPRYGSVDPTPWLAVTFPLFFGFVLGDMVFGLLAGGVALLALRKKWGGGMGHDVAVLALVCAASAFVFGLAFGEALGDLGAQLGLRPILFHRQREVIGFLGLAVAVGGAHVLVGAALGVVTAYRAGRRRMLVARGAKLGLLIAGCAAAAALAAGLSRAWLTGSLAALALFLVVAVITGGPLAALDLVLGLGNILSYSRLMALGLASTMLADVANSLGRSLSPGVAGVAIALLLHAVNFSLGLVSPVVAALRLHYVEFFERFYVEGGAPFRPFALTA
jgi:V/A-type H+-transporting ATPase subunit I